MKALIILTLIPILFFLGYVGVHHGIALACLAYFAVGMFYWLISLFVGILEKDKGKLEYFNDHALLSIMIYGIGWFIGICYVLIFGKEKEA